MRDPRCESPCAIANATHATPKGGTRLQKATPIFAQTPLLRWFLNKSSMSLSTSLLSAERCFSSCETLSSGLSGDEWPEVPANGNGEGDGTARVESGIVCVSMIVCVLDERMRQSVTQSIGSRRSIGQSSLLPSKGHLCLKT